MRRAAVPALLILAVAAAYANAIGASFQFDDWNVVVGDPRVQSVSAWWRSMPGIRPLLKLSYALDHAAGGGPSRFHAINVVIHGCNALLLFALFEWVARARGLTRRDGRFVGFAGAALFALHPVQTEAVTYVSGRSTSLAATFVLASLVCWTLGRERGLTTWVRVVSPALFACAVAVKETAIVAPAAFALLGAAASDRPIDRRGIARDLAGHAAVVALGLTALAASATYRHLLATSLQVRGVGENLRAQAVAVSYLVGQLVRWDRLNVDPALSAPESWTVGGVLSVLAILAGIVCGLLLLRRGAAWGFGVLWFFLWLAPTNSLLPRLDVVNDRQLYLALAGPAWLVAWSLGRLATRRRLCILALLAVVLTTGTYLRNRVYADEVVFWEDVTAKSPWNARAFTNLGVAYSLEKRPDAAMAAYRKALELDPGDYKAAINLRMLRERPRPRRRPEARRTRAGR